MSNYQRGTRPSATEPQTTIAQDDHRGLKQDSKNNEEGKHLTFHNSRWH